VEPANILVIEDDYIVARTIERSLRSDEFHVTLASRGEKGIFIAHQNPPDLVILDIIMPDMDGYQVCRAMRADAQLAEIPILFLTAKVRPQDKIAGFNVGADDYLCKPFNVDELILRVRAILRRTRPQGDQPGDLAPGSGAEYGSPFCITLDGYILDTRTFELQTPQRGTIRLTPLQYDLLYHLMTHPGETYTPGRLLDEIWDFPSGKGSPDLVRVHIKTLRERIENDPTAPSFIRTVPGKGYTAGNPPLSAGQVEQ
jgi:two-component system, OmpR family, response regulator RpaA